MNNTQIIDTYAKDDIILQLTEEVSELKIDLVYLESDLNIHKDLLKQFKSLAKSSMDSFDILYVMYLDVVNAKK